ncbi:MAG: choice-of-anchor V domain-containing protein [Candidatus Poseidoniaceae archaeon]
MRLKIISVVIVGLMLASTVPLSMGKQNGIYNSASGCGCHYASSATVSMSGHPSAYTAGSTYTLQISVSGGVSGSAGGFSLEVDKGTLSTGGVGIMAVKVNQGGKSATHTTSSYRSWSVDWTAPSSGSGTVTFDIAGIAANGNGQNSGDSKGTASYQVSESGPAPNNPPSVSNVQLSPTNPVTTDTLTLTYNFQDSDGDSESGSMIRWYKDGVLESSRNDQMTVPPSLTSKGESWNVTVTPSDGTDDGSPVHSSNLLVVNSIPMMTTAQITPNDAVDTDDLTVSWTSSDADGDTRTVSGIEWYVDGSKVTAFDGDETIPSVAIRDGDVWYAKVKVNDGEADSDWITTQDVTIGTDNTAPVMVSVNLGGPYHTMDDLMATAQANDADNDALTYEWDWPATNGAISSSTLPYFYTEKGESWTVRCRVTDGVVYSDWMESSAVIIQNTAPVLNELAIDQETVFFDTEATYSFDATDIDGDTLVTSETWELNGDTLTLTLSVYDDEMAYSNTLSDTVQIVNSLPTLSYDGPISQSALVPLSPTIQSDDANGDTVTTSWQWMRNGFMTDENGSTISESKLGAGDVWTAMITPNDGLDDGPVLMIDFTISNTEPTASITAPESLIQGAMVTFSAMSSSDIDGAVVNAIWSVDGMVMHNGMTFTTTMTEQLNLQVKVIDDLGADDVYSQTFTGTQAPMAMNTQVKLDGSDAVITWEGDSEEWAVVHNGQVIDTTSELKYRHSPTMEGQHVYSIMPVIDGQTIQDDSAGSTASVELSSNLVPEAPGPSDTAGLIFSIVLLLVGLIGVVSSFIPRRD